MKKLLVVFILLYTSSVFVQSVGSPSGSRRERMDSLFRELEANNLSTEV